MTCEYNSTGKIPLKRKDGSIVPYAWVFCSCREEPEDYRPPRAEDIDFPVSWDWWRYFKQKLNGEYVPSLLEGERGIPKVEIEVKRPEPQIKRGEFNYLFNKVNEHLESHKKKRGKIW